MFLRSDGLVVTQWEHSRLSGRLAMLMSEAAGVACPFLCGAIALHDWPHFADGALADRIAIGRKTSEQQRELTMRLAQPLPLDAFTELIVRLHWKRLSEQDPDSGATVEASRIAELRRQLRISHREADRFDQWTDLCDTLGFHLSRADCAEGSCTLPNPIAESGGWELSWSVSRDSLRVRGLPSPGKHAISLLAFASDGYPQALQSHFLHLRGSFTSA